MATAMGVLLGALAVLGLHALGTAQRDRGGHPVVQDVGRAFHIPDAQLERGRRVVVFDVANDGAGGEAPPGLTHAARLLNVYALHGVPPRDVRVSLVLHGDATSAVLTDEAHRAHASGANPHAALVQRLQHAGIDVIVCGQALERQGYPRDGVLEGVEVSASAMTSLIDAQRAGAALLTY